MPKISDLPPIASVALADLLPLVDDPAGTPATAKATVSQLLAAILPAIYPVGITVELDTDPAAAWGFGTWQETGAGRVAVGLDTGDVDFDTIGKTGGAKTVTLTAAQSGLPAHGHTVNDPGHVHTQRFNSATTGPLSGPTTAPDTSSNNTTNYAITTASATTGLTVNNANAANAADAHSNLQPYITVRKWKRVA